MKDKIILLIAIVGCVCLIIFTDFGKANKIKYDCRLAEFHPDFPIEVREECRKIIKQRIEENERKNDKSLHENSSNLLRT